MRRPAALILCVFLLTTTASAQTDKAKPAATPVVEPSSSVMKELAELDRARATVDKAFAKLAAKPHPRVLVIPIREEIDFRTAVYVERQMRRVKPEKFDLVVVDMDTPGGEMSAMMRICTAFSRSLDRNGVPVISFVNTDAYSAGAVISIACDRIYITPGGKIGAAAGIFVTPEGKIADLPDYVRRKFTSAWRAEVRSFAKAKGHPPAIGMGMVDDSLEVVEVELDGKKRCLLRSQLDQLEGKGDNANLPWQKAEGAIKELRVISAKGDLITLDYEEAVSVGLAQAVVDSKEALFEKLGLKDPVVVTGGHSWSEEFFGFLASGPVKGILLMLGLMGIYLELKAPGFGAPGILGILALALFFFSQYFMGLADYTGALVFGIGAVLLAVEIFVIPGFGVTGVVGIIMMFAGLVLGMQNFVLPNFDVPWDVNLFLTNLAVMGAALIGLLVFAVIMAKIMPHAPLFKRLVLTSTGPSGVTASGTALEGTTVAVGDQGRALSMLRPAGRVQVGERFYDVVAEGAYVERGAPVQVIRIEGNRIVVRKVS